MDALLCSALQGLFFSVTILHLVGVLRMHRTYCILLHCTGCMYCTALRWTTALPYCTVLHFTAQHCTLLYQCCRAVPIISCLLFLDLTVTYQLLDKPRSQVSSLLPSGTYLHVNRAEGSAFPTLVDFHRFLRTHALALSTSQFLQNKRSPRKYEYMHSGGARTQ